MGSFDATVAVRTLKHELDERLQVLEGYPIEAELAAEGDLPALLKIALKNEAEASEIAALWMPTTPDTEVRLGFARQVGDEARHYRLIADYLGGHGISLEGFDPLAGGHTPLFQALAGLETTVERLSAGQFTREAIALRRNAMFIDWLEHQGHHEVAHLYSHIIQPDEQHHHHLGVSGLARLMVDDADLERARAAMTLTLSIADEMKKAVRARTGAKTLPGC